MIICIWYVHHVRWSGAEAVDGGGDKLLAHAYITPKMIVTATAKPISTPVPAGENGKMIEAMAIMNPTNAKVKHQSTNSYSFFCPSGSICSDRMYAQIMQMNVQRNEMPPSNTSSPLTYSLGSNGFMKAITAPLLSAMWANEADWSMKTKPANVMPPMNPETTMTCS